MATGGNSALYIERSKCIKRCFLRVLKELRFFKRICLLIACPLMEMRGFGFPARLSCKLCYFSQCFKNMNCNLSFPTVAILKVTENRVEKQQSFGKSLFIYNFYLKTDIY